LEDPGVDRRVILKRIFTKWDVGMAWIDLAQGRGRWKAVVNVVMNLWVPSNEGTFLTSLRPASFSRRTLLLAVSYSCTALYESSGPKRYNLCHSF
jgi:hypothetical protein